MTIRRLLFGRYSTYTLLKNGKFQTSAVGRAVVVVTRTGPPKTPASRKLLSVGRYKVPYAASSLASSNIAPFQSKPKPFRLTGTPTTHVVTVDYIYITNNMDAQIDNALVNGALLGHARAASQHSGERRLILRPLRS